MFGFLKKKITGFIDSLVKKEEEKKDAAAEESRLREEVAEEKEIREAPAFEEPAPAKEEPLAEVTQEPVRAVPEAIVEKPAERLGVAVAPPKEKTVTPTAPPEAKTVEPLSPRSVEAARVTPTPSLKPAEAEKVAPPLTQQAPAKIVTPHLAQPVEAVKVAPQLKQQAEAGKVVSPSKQQTAAKTVTPSFTRPVEAANAAPLRQQMEAKPAELPKREFAADKTEPPFPAAWQKPREERQLAPKLGLLGRVKSIFTNEVTINESEAEPLLEELRMALLESDVSMDTTDFLVADLRKRLVGSKVKKSELSAEVKAAVRSSLLDVLSSSYSSDDLLDRVRSKKPFVILFVGPNGAGKTTSIAKFAQLFKDAGLSSVISASDSFRAAAIEQAVHHGEALGVKVVKHAYGADPAAVAFDAIAHAKAKGVDVVLVDTAGRQETNYNLIKEMQKINRVVQPDLRVFVGEAVAGHALVEQVKKFKEAIGVDAIVLTKLDCDAKGGSSFSLAHETKTPILFVGTGQSYHDLQPFKPEWIVDNVLAA